MKRCSILTCSLLIVLLSLNISAQMDTLTILHFNDTHSCLAPLAPRTQDLQGTRGGIARAATVIGMAKLTEPNVLVLHGGDSFIGDLFFNHYYGAAELQLLNSIGVDAMAVGNHEFDLTPAVLDTALDMAFPAGGFPLLSANIILDDPAVQSLKNYIKPYIVKQMGNMKIGIFGMTTPEAAITSIPSPVVIDTNGAALIQTAAATVAALKTENCNVIICLSHLGLNIDEALASYIPGINLIVGAHDHYLLTQPIEITNPEGKTTLIVQAGSFYSNIGEIKLAVSSSNVSKISYQTIELNGNIPEEPTVKAAVNSLIAEIESVYGPVYSQMIAYAPVDLDEVADVTGPGPYETTVGKLVTTAYRWKTKTDVAITVGGSTAQMLYHGPVVAADIFRMISYGFNEVNGLDYRIATFKMTGLDLLTAFESALSQVQYNDEFLPQVSGMTYQLNLSNPAGSRVTAMLIGGNPLELAKTYSVTTNEFLLAAIGSMFNIPVSDVYVYPDSSEFQVVTEYVIANGLDQIVPVELASFTARASENSVELKWSTATETNNKGFEIERSLSPTPSQGEGTSGLHLPLEGGRGVGWQKIGFISGNGTSTQPHQYSYFDKSVSPGIYYYRLKQIDYDGSYKYSNEIEVSCSVPNKYELSQNYPNPFNPTTVINYQLKTTGKTTLIIYNLLGQEVKTLVNEVQSAGEHKVKWNAGGMASGVYMYRLESNGFVQTRKMILTK